MLYIGCHLSISGGYTAMAKDAASIGANAFACFLRNPRGGRAHTQKPADVAGCLDIIRTMDPEFGKIVVHAPYTLNPCAARPDLRDFAREIMIDDLHRLEALPGNYYNFHPGCHVGQGADEGVKLTAQLLNDVMPDAGPSVVLIETMAGKGTEIGRSFEEIARIIDGVADTSKLGVCLDTCHIWDGGYDIVGNFEGVLEEFDRIIGLDRLLAIHLNDSLNDNAAHKDRHARIGEGHIGFEALLRVVTHPKIKGLPLILETPNELPGYKAEIEMFRKAEAAMN